MLKIKVNYPKTFAPIAMAKGTTEQRLQLARLMNLRFYDNLQDGIKNREIKPGTFKNILRRTIGQPIKIVMAESRNPKAGRLLHSLNEKGEAIGYTLELPYTAYYKNIHQSTSLVFLQETQKLFEEVLNPKFFQRFINMLAKGYNTKNVSDFYLNNISKTKKLTGKALDKFLENKSVTEQIETLQFIRYQLIKEQNACVGLKGIDRSIARHTGVKYIRKDDFYEFKDYDFEGKFALIESRLKRLIQTERAKNKNSVL